MDSRNHNDGLKTKEGFKQRTAKDLLVEDDEEEVRLGLGCTSDKKRKGKRSCSNERIGVSSPPLFSSPFCQVEKCKADLTGAKTYHRRHKVCELHSKASVVLLAGLHQRFCQQCSRFHEVSEFDETKRSCRRRLAGHNERRRKSSSEPHGEVSSQQGRARSWKEIIAGELVKPRKFKSLTLEMLNIFKADRNLLRMLSLFCHILMHC